MWRVNKEKVMRRSMAVYVEGGRTQVLAHQEARAAAIRAAERSRKFGLWVVVRANYRAHGHYWLGAAILTAFFLSQQGGN